jgi:hypothetical protein
MRDDDYYITKHEETDGSTLIHVCSYKNPCGDVLACRACRYR